MAWEPAKGGFIGVMKRNASVDSIRWFEIEPKILPPLDERLGRRRENPLRGDGNSQPAGLPQRRRIARHGSPKPRLTRWTIDLAGKTNRAKREQLDDLDSEMPHR